MKNAWNRMGWVTAGVLALLVVAAITGIVAGGPLDPPGPPGSTQPLVEPRTPISLLPYTITQPGSYYLTKNLTVVGTNGITVQASDVTIDLNGFTLSSSSSAITEGAASPTRSHWVIKNGTIEAGFRGIEASHVTNSQFSSLILSGTANLGIWAGSGITLDHVDVHGSSGSYAIALGEAARVSDCTVEASGSGSLSLGDRSIVKGCSVSGGNLGIAAGANNLVDSNVVRSVNFQGINAGAGSAITNNVIGQVGAGGYGVGIVGSALVSGNLIDGIGGTNGIGVAVFGSANRIVNNQIQHAHWGMVFFDSGGNAVYQNAVRDLAVIFDDSFGNQKAGVEAPAFAANPWSNLSY